MSGDAPRTIFNSQEKATIADQDKQTDLNQRMVQQALYATAGNDQNLSGVLHGFICTLSNGAKTVSISTGVALLEKGTIIFPDSTKQWIELETATTISIPSGVGDDVWCVVEIEPASTISQANVDVFDGGAGTYVSLLKNKELRSQPIISIRIGPSNTPNVPEFPAGTGGRIPIALFFMDAAGEVTDGSDSVIYCRPILRAFGGDQPRGPAFNFAPDDLITGDAIVRGGGVQIDDGGTNITFGVTQGKFPSSRIGFSLKSVFPGDVGGLDMFDTSIGTPPDAVLYAYAVPPPYQAGYDPLAPREFIVGGPTVSLKFQSSDYRTTTNCIIVVSETAPGSSLVSPIQGQPPSGYTGSGVIHDLPWLTSGSPADSDPSEWVYIGAFESVAAGFLNQNSQDGGHIFPQERVPAQEFLFGNGNTTPNTYDLRVPNAPSATTELQGNFPVTATKLNGLIFLSVAAAVTEPDFMDLTIFNAAFGDNRDYRVYKTQSGGTSINIPTWEYHVFAPTISITPDPSTDADFVATMKWTSYVDRIIANR